MSNSPHQGEDDLYANSAMPAVATVIALPLCGLDLLISKGLFAHLLTCADGGNSNCGETLSLALIITATAILGLVALGASWHYYRDDPRAVGFGLTSMLLTGAPIGILLYHLSQS